MEFVTFDQIMRDVAWRCLFDITVEVISISWMGTAVNDLFGPLKRS